MMVIKSGLEPSATGKIVNSGQTPAVDVLLSAGVELLPDGDIEFTQNAPDPDPDKPLITVHVGDPVTVNVFRETPVTVQEERDFLDGKTRLYLFGTMTYKDMFGDKHTTEFRYRSRPVNAEFLAGKRSNMEPCREGNRIT